MKNFVQRGDEIEVTATAAVASGDVVQIGQLIGVAALDAADGDRFNIRVTGVFVVPKTAAQAWTEGQLVYWTGTAMSTAGTGNALVGVAVADALAADTTGVVRFNGCAHVDGA